MRDSCTSPNVSSVRPTGPGHITLTQMRQRWKKIVINKGGVLQRRQRRKQLLAKRARTRWLSNYTYPPRGKEPFVISSPFYLEAVTLIEYFSFELLFIEIQLKKGSR